MPEPSFDIEHVARLARLTLEPAERARLAADLARIVAYVSVLAELPPDDAAPAEAGGGGPWRDDEPRPSLPEGEIVRNAPAMERGHFIVPRVIGP